MENKINTKVKYRLRETFMRLSLAPFTFRFAMYNYLFKDTSILVEVINEEK